VYKAYSVRWAANMTANICISKSIIVFLSIRKCVFQKTFNIMLCCTKKINISRPITKICYKEKECKMNYYKNVVHRKRQRKFVRRTAYEEPIMYRKECPNLEEQFRRNVNDED